MGSVNVITLLNIYYFRSDRINFLGVQSDRRSDCIIIATSMLYAELTSRTPLHSKRISGLSMPWILGFDRGP